jgi:DNA-binding MarR family transcriptional regulator/catechol 2,3-dioxygenase-like lactoylglutathione lyase family enzyme
MTDQEANYRSTATLMREARGTYARSIRAQLHAIGVDDLPRNGVFILAEVGSAGGLQQELPTELGVSKQAVSQLIDTLVSRGYLERVPDPQDRRRVSLELTQHGQEALDAATRGVEDVDEQLAERVSAEKVGAMRSGLAALAEIKAADTAAGTGRPRPAREFRRFSPIFPVSDLAAALAHYAALGFDTNPYEDGEVYGFASRDGVQLHLELHQGHPAADHAASAYLYVRDADEVYAQWTRPGIGGITRPVGPMAYKFREGSHIDPDGNVIRFGSPADE